MSKKINLSEEYDDYVLQYVDSYTVSQLVGVGKYDKKTFQSFISKHHISFVGL